MTDIEIKTWQLRFIAWLQANWLQSDSAHDIHHLHKVWHNVGKIISLENNAAADRLVLVAATYFHDLVSFPKDHPERNLSSLASADKTVNILKAEFNDFPASKIPAVHHAIHAHSFSANVICNSFEAMVLQDGDRLEALGATGIARLFYTAGKMNTAMYDPSDPLALNRKPDDKKFALDHIGIKLLKISETMKTKAGQLLAETEIAFVKTFAGKLADEIQLR